MTQRSSGQDFDPKHRIIGAVVVVALAVIFIPMVLGERGPTAPAPAPEGTQVAVTRVTAVAPESRAEPTPAEAAPEPAPPAAEPAPIAKAAPAAEPKRPESGWVVQVGTFTNAANATRLERRLRSAGHTVLNERIALNGGKAVRLRVGPFSDRDTATRAQQRIQESLGVKGVVLAYP